MPTSLYMPDVKVEIAFDSGVATAAASRTWTDVSAYVELADGIDIVHGRQDERSTAGANSLKLVVDNTDGRFTPANAAGAYYPNVKIGRPIRVTATPVAGAASTRFVGYVDEWPTEWDGTGYYSRATLTATSRRARLAAGAELKSIIEEELLADSPSALYPMGEPAGATAAVSVAPTVVGDLVTEAGSSVTFGAATGPATDDLTAPTFAGGRGLRAAAPISGAAQVFIGCYFNSSTSQNADIVRLQQTVFGATLTIKSIAGGGIAAACIPFEGSSSATATYTTYNDGLTHHAEAVFESGATSYTLKLYVDGILLETVTTAPGTPRTIGADLFMVGCDRDFTFPFFGTIAHAYWGLGAPSATRVSAHSAAGLTGWAGDGPGVRLARYATYGKVATAEQSFDLGNTPMAHVNTDGVTALAMMTVVETTEGGILFDARDNTLTFHDRDRRYGAASAFTLNASLQQIEEGYRPQLDRTQLVNDVTAQLSSGLERTRVLNQASIDAYGMARDSVELASTDTGEPLQAASWRVNTYSEPVARAPELSVNLVPLAAATQALILAAEVSTRFTASNLPTQLPASSTDYFIEGWTESIGMESYSFTFNVSPAAVWNVWIVEDATYGAYDSNPLAY